MSRPPSNSSAEAITPKGKEAGSERNMEIEEAVAAADAEQQMAKAALADAVRCATPAPTNHPALSKASQSMIA